MRLLLLYIAILANAVHCFRIPLSYDKQSPFLKHSVINSKSHESFSWSNMFLGKFLHRSDIIELGPRGVRFIFHQPQIMKPAGALIAKSENCKPTDLALCYSSEGWFLPSEGKWGSTIFNITSSGSLLQDEVLRLFADENACHGENQGVGRAYYYALQKVQYSITSCDILQGRYILAYVKGDETVYVYPQTFGPISYFLIIISATISTGAIAFFSKFSQTSTAKSKSERIDVVVVGGGTPTLDNSISLMERQLLSYALNINAWSSIIVCAAVFYRDKIHFHTAEDALVFWFGVVSGLFYSMIVLETLTLYHSNSSFQMDGCMYALEVISIALYRTPENPYSFILSLFMACRIWEKYFLTCHGRNQPPSVPLRCFDIIVALVNFQLLCEIGIKPQYVFQEAWPFYFITILFLTYCMVKYQWMIAITVV